VSQSIALRQLLDRIDVDMPQCELNIRAVGRAIEPVSFAGGITMASSSTRDHSDGFGSSRLRQRRDNSEVWLAGLEIL